jgi:hypothetical protein
MGEEAMDKIGIVGLERFRRISRMMELLLHSPFIYLRANMATLRNNKQIMNVSQCLSPDNTHGAVFAIVHH